MAKDLIYYFKQHSNDKLSFDLTKLPPDISNSTIVAVESELKSVVNPNETASSGDIG